MGLTSPAWHVDSVGRRCYDCEMNSRCRDCLAGLEHCHGALIRHRLHRSECTEENCVGPELTVHGFVLDCDAVGCDCANTDAPSAQAV